MDITSYPRTPRLINRFSLGADPEFIFTNTRGQYIHAETLGMNTMQAFGCDMSGRQAELRAYPSKFALEVVASMLDELRWMAYAYKETLGYNWNAVAYNGKDGCGGHVHFGRQKSKRDKDVKILDDLTRRLLVKRVFDPMSFDARYEGSGRKYGVFGDYRIQKHGFEYRTFPTQMSSPWLAYFTLVTSKLAVYEGKATTPDLLELLKKYQYRDDDAAIALRALQRLGYPVEYACDFKLLWGIRTKVEDAPKNLYIPSVIQAEDRTCQELFDYLVHGTPLPPRIPQPTWGPYELNPRFTPILVQLHTLNHLPNIGMDIVSRDHKFSVQIGCAEVLVPPGLNVDKKLMRDTLNALSSCKFNFREGSKGSITLYVPRSVNESLQLCNKLNELLSTPTLFPTCRAENIQKMDWSRWDITVENPKPMYKGSLIGVYEAPPPSPKSVKSGKTSWSVQYQRALQAERARLAQPIPPAPRPARPAEEFPEPIDYIDEEGF